MDDISFSTVNSFFSLKVHLNILIVRIIMIIHVQLFTLFYLPELPLDSFSYDINVLSCFECSLI